MTRVLIVEDNRDLANMVRSFLEFESYVVDVFHDGSEGLRSILASPYDLAILDWDLPGTSGLEILTAFRQRGAQTPVIMLTGKNTIEDKEEGLNGGADDYLTKPFNMKELGARVRALIRRTANSSQNHATLADITLDLANKRASRGGRTHILPGQEFQLLEFAARYPHLQPSSQDLMHMFWPNGGDSSEQLLRMAIRRLRKKLDPKSELLFSHLFVESKTVDGQTSSAQAKGPEPEVDPYTDTILDGKYELVELIGGGGSGLVYQGRHVVLGNSLAVKVLHVNVLSQTDAVLRFQREAKLTALLLHPNIVEVRDFGVSEQNQPYLVMELVAGPALDEVLEQNRQLPIEEVIDIFCQACTGLEHAHKKGLLHRDLKPSNLMLTSTIGGELVVKIVDFGLARETDDNQNLVKITQTGYVLGSPPYMSPEQCRGHKLDARSDIYSLGCALYETVQGVPPFMGAEAVEILVKHLSHPLPELIRDNLPPQMLGDLNKIIAKCLAKERENRYHCASELLDALIEFRNTYQLRSDRAASAPPDMANLPWAERKATVMNWLERRFSHDTA